MERGRVSGSELTTGEWREGGERCEGRKGVWMGRKGNIWWGLSGGEKVGASEGKRWAGESEGGRDRCLGDWV